LIALKNNAKDHPAKMPDKAVKNFVPNPGQMALMPEISGNEVNGLGETDFRRPRYVYWGNDPDDTAHGDVQRWFYTVDPGLEEFSRLRAERQNILDAPLRAVDTQQMPLTASKVAKATTQFIKSGVFDKYEAVAFNSDWAFEGIDIGYENLIILGFQHTYDEIEKAPKAEAGVEVMRQYKRAAYGAKFMANWLHEQGWEAEPLTGPMSGKITMIPAALKAGFGELGKHGSIITPEFGSSFRLSAVLTDAPLPLNGPRAHGIDDFCKNCRICETACPTDAILPEKQMVRGAQKWYVDFDKCLPFFNEHQGCAICIAVCPWSRPGIGVNLADKLMKRAERLGDHSLTKTKA
jgi:epoxyqueuosine reductase